MAWIQSMSMRRRVSLTGPSIGAGRGPPKSRARRRHRRSGTVPDIGWALVQTVSGRSSSRGRLRGRTGRGRRIRAGPRATFGMAQCRVVRGVSVMTTVERGRPWARASSTALSRRGRAAAAYGVPADPGLGARRGPPADRPDEGLVRVEPHRRRPRALRPQDPGQHLRLLVAAEVERRDADRGASDAGTGHADAAADSHDLWTALGRLLRRQRAVVVPATSRTCPRQRPRGSSTARSGPWKSCSIQGAGQAPVDPALTDDTHDLAGEAR